LKKSTILIKTKYVAIPDINMSAPHKILSKNIDKITQTIAILIGMIVRIIPKKLESISFPFKSSMNIINIKIKSDPPPIKVI
jgi:hypothetical protein